MKFLCLGLIPILVVLAIMASLMPFLRGESEAVGFVFGSAAALLGLALGHACLSLVARFRSS